VLLRVIGDRENVRKEASFMSRITVD